jgi:hypothetical protein
MWQFGPGVIGKDEPVSDWIERSAGHGRTGRIGGEESGPDQPVAFGGDQQSIEFLGGKSSLQEKQIDGQREWIAGGELRKPVDRYSTPLEIGQIV